MNIRKRKRIYVKKDLKRINVDCNIFIVAVDLSNRLKFFATFHKCREMILSVDVICVKFANREKNCLHKSRNELRTEIKILSKLNYLQQNYLSRTARSSRRYSYIYVCIRIRIKESRMEKARCMYLCDRTNVASFQYIGPLEFHLQRRLPGVCLGNTNGKISRRWYVLVFRFRFDTQVTLFFASFPAFDQSRTL